MYRAQGNDVGQTFRKLYNGSRFHYHHKGIVTIMCGDVFISISRKDMFFSPFMP